MINPSSPEIKTLQRYRNILLVVSIITYLLLVIGGLLRVSDSGAACIDWPMCLGQWLPPLESTARLDYLHRAMTLLAAPLFLVATWIAWRSYRNDRSLGYPVILAGLLFAMQIAIGALIALNVDGPFQSILAPLHLGLSLVTLALLLFSTVSTYFKLNVSSSKELIESQHPARNFLQGSNGRMILLLVLVLFVLMLSGVLVNGTQAANACQGWPFCGGDFSFQYSLAEWLNIIHRGLVLISAVLIFVTFFYAWRKQRSNTAVIVSATAMLVLFVAQALLGSRMVAGYHVELLALHQATAIAVWASAVILLGVSINSPVSLTDQVNPDASHRSLRILLKDFLLLTKPIVVALLLVTTFAGMVIGGQSWPPLSTTLWTLLGGFLAAGGSGAINQYIDRFDDRKMQRTQKRPIPAGRLNPGEGLAFGVGIALASFYIMVAYVNFLAALLTLAGIIYYVLIYSIFLKKTTVQNIVIGGGAGAIPPLVGWAAATGSLNIPSLFLFAIVFMWTPPHFWALALVRRKDYARAGVPMLPVVRGEQETRWQIFLYTAELVGLTLLLPLFGLGGSIYLVGALLLGGWLLGSAWRVWKVGGNKLAWKMYRYSSMYLAFIFFVLMVDRLLG